MADNPHSTKKLGMMFTLGGWILGFLVLGIIFTKILDTRSNPNQSVATSSNADYREIVLQRNSQGHYVFNGEINQRVVTFLVDTGATTTAIPGALRDYLRLEEGPAISVTTANGVATAYLTRLDELKMGDILLKDVRASLNPSMGGKGVLLGMNVLKHMELIQRDQELIIRLYM